MIGFGFRERDVAIDLLGNLQQFGKSIERELQAKSMKVKEIPKLGEGEKIHINLVTGKRKSTKASKDDKKSAGAPILLKKPPKFDSNKDDADSRESKMNIGTRENDANPGLVPGNAVVQESPVPGELDDDFGDDWNDFQEATPRTSSS